MMNKLFDIIIDGSWNQSTGIVLWGQTGHGLYADPAELKLKLFAWHQESFFGTLINETDYYAIPAISLSPVTALNFLTRLPEPEFITLSWSENITHLQKAARIIQNILAQGIWMPDQAKWDQGRRSWKVKTPDPIEFNKVGLIEEWLEATINEIIEKNPAASQAWQQLVETYPLLGHDLSGAAKNIDEENWLIRIGWKQDTTPFRISLQLTEPDERLPWTLRVTLQDKENPAALYTYPNNGPDNLKNLPESWLPFVKERTAKETVRWINCLPWLECPGEKGRIKETLTDDEAWEFLTTGSIRLAEAGFSVLLPSWWDKLRRQKPRLKFKTRSSVGTSPNSMFGIQQLVQFDWKLAIGNLEISAGEFQQLAEEKKRLMKIRGQWIQLDPAFIQQVKKTLSRKKNGFSLSEVLQMHLLQEVAVTTEPAEIDDEITIPMEIELTGHLAQMMQKLNQVTALPIETPTLAFQGTLRNYQKTGYSWLLFLRQFGLGGCLADDMGLGKTIQFIAYLLSVKEKKLSDTPSLLICPTSVTGNWLMEINRFAPSLKVYMHYGPRRAKDEEFSAAIENMDLVITTYTLAQIDKEALQEVEWDCICLDEAQNIKNAYTKQAGAIRRLQGRHKIALTGTPMENRLTELWSIMDFLNRGYLGSLNVFKKQFVHVIEKKKDTQTVQQIQRLVRPFLLRRLKTDPAIAPDLPEKQEYKEFVTLTAEQASIYESILAGLFDKLDQATPMERRGLILTALTRLKQVCDHPALALKEGKGRLLRNRSVKLERLIEMVAELRAEGDKCLIFTQYVEMGFILQQMLEKELGEPALYMHGGTPKAQRDALIARFQDNLRPSEEEAGIFILSLKAGGTGLNLTAANHVFHYDRWWNPAVENQATDRAYRIGQRRLVQVHKFVTLGTMEERIDELIEQKQRLNELIVGGGENWITELSTGELREIFALRREWAVVD